MAVPAPTGYPMRALILRKARMGFDRIVGHPMAGARPIDRWFSVSLIRGCQWMSVDADEKAKAHAERSFVTDDRVARLHEPAILALGRRPEHEICRECRAPLSAFTLCLSPNGPEADHEFGRFGKREGLPEHNLGLPFRVAAPEQFRAADLNLDPFLDQAELDRRGRATTELAAGEAPFTGAPQRDHRERLLLLCGGRTREAEQNDHQPRHRPCRGHSRPRADSLDSVRGYMRRPLGARCDTIQFRVRKTLESYRRSSYPRLRRSGMLESTLHV